MKKYLILTILIVTTFITVNVNFYANETYNYNLSFNDGYHYNLETGIYGSNPEYATTQKIKIINNIININSLESFSHIQFYKDYEYLGYYNTPDTTYKNSKYLGEQTTTSLTVPTNATHFVLSANKNNLLTSAVPELNNNSLNNVFGENNLLSDNILKWSVISGNMSYNDTYLTIEFKANEQFGMGIYNVGTVLNGHVVYEYFNIKGTTNIFLGITSNETYLSKNGNQIYSNKKTINNGSINYTIGDNSISGFKTVEFKNSTLIDLTKLSLSNIDIYILNNNIQIYLELKQFKPISIASFYAIRATSITITPPSDNKPFNEKLTDFVSNLGLGNKGTMLLTIVFIGIVNGAIFFAGGKLTHMLIATTVSITVFTYINWLPDFLIVLLVLLLLFIVYSKNKDGDTE